MSSIKGLVLVLALALTHALLVSSEDSKPDLSDAAREKIQQGLDLAKEGFARAENAISQARERLGPLASNFTRDFKERFNDGVQKAQEVLTQVKETVSSHVPEKR
uniref:Ribosomal RNA small subunit methyltransferase H n=1 Tax=Lygus hesperus TaxID=30085 RepID=A0A0A9X7H2_LYGHE